MMERSSELVHKSVFNLDVSNMNNRSKLKPLFIQILVENYIKNVYHSNNVHMYPELINDFDVFTKDLQCYEKLYLNGKLMKDITYNVILNEVPSEEYLESYEVKHGTPSYLNSFKNLKQVLTKIPYPPNTKIILALVPGEYNFNTELLTNPDEFEHIKHGILQHDDDQLYDIFNSMINNTSLERKNINMAMLELWSDCDKCKLNEYGEKNIDKNDVRWLKSNLERIELKIITLEDLEKFDLKAESIHEILNNLM